MMHPASLWKQQPPPKDINYQEGGIIAIDKPYQWTSFDAVKKIRGTLKIKKIGHAGTLDPLATGLLILCTGKMTKKIEYFQSQEKEYEGILVLGKTTPSVDLETEFDSETSIERITEEMIIGQLDLFQGEIQQIPPAHSAVKVQGERVYKKARKGEKVKLEPRTVLIKAFEITHISLPEVHFRVVCSKGTYIRSLVRDFGNELGVGAYLYALRRTRIGDIHVKDAYTITDFLAQVNPE
jgi:tRNA pseudouridine55 synthase